MKRFAIFIVLCTVLFLVVSWFVALPIANVILDDSVEFELHAETMEAILLGFLSLGLVMGFADWIAELISWRPWLTGVIGWGTGIVAMSAWMEITPPS